MVQSAFARKAVLIDLDGTLLDTLADIHAAVNLMSQRYGWPLAAIEEVRGWIGKGALQLVRRMLARVPAALQIDEDEAQRVYLAAYDECNGRYATVYPGVREGLARFRAQGIACACVTNKPYAPARAILEHTGLLAAFDLVVGGDGVALKPQPGGLLAACQKLALAPHQVVMVGDSENDLLAARAAGCACLLVPYGYSVDQPVQALGADAIVPTLLAASEWFFAAQPQPPITTA